ncbi:MAG: inorganic phosphate transporter [Fimbriimonadaceae bacterium]|nr:inorganic phosphate transporter [Alphaproteobacteria bacterium]
MADFSQQRILPHLSLSNIFRFVVAAIFILAVMASVNMLMIGVPGGITVVGAAMVGAYMAMNIGANDVANNVGPAVGSTAITLFGAILIAVIFEASGALIAGGDVVSTIKKGIIDPAQIGDVNTFIWVMVAALMAAAIWLNIATMLGAPVSTTHSIVGGVLGAGIAAGGWSIANWDKMGAIAASWIISPAMGGLIAAAFLYLIERTIIHQRDKSEAAKRMVPILIAVMAWAFSSYLVLKGLKQIWKPDFFSALGVGLIVAIIAFILVKPLIVRAAKSMSNHRDGVNHLFTIPLIFGAALLSFAHGANDVANAVGPLAAINDAVLNGVVHAKASIPLWVMMVGAAGIALGLALFGPKLIRTVGTEITDLDKMRAFCVALAAAITVIVATQLGLPVSSTHIAVGGVFGVGFLREYLEADYEGMLHEIREHHEDDEDPQIIEDFLEEFEQASFDEKGEMIAELKLRKAESGIPKRDRKSLRNLYRRELVRRSMLFRIAAAWIITVPVSGLMAAFFYFFLRGVYLP